SARAALPELPAARAERFESEVGLSADTAELRALPTEDGGVFERGAARAAAAACSAASYGGARAGGGAEPVPLANWVTNELTARLGDEDPQASKVSPAAVAQLVAALASNKGTNAL